MDCWGSHWGFFYIFRCVFTPVCLLSFQVTGIVGRADVLACLLFLLAFLSYNRYVITSWGSLVWGGDQRQLSVFDGWWQRYFPLLCCMEVSWPLLAAMVMLMRTKIHKTRSQHWQSLFHWHYSWPYTRGGLVKILKKCLQWKANCLYVEWRTDRHMPAFQMHAVTVGLWSTWSERVKECV